MNGDLFIKLPYSEILKGKKICSILAYDDKQVLFVSDFNGIFIFNGERVEQFSTDIDDFLKMNQVFCATINKSQLAIGTVRNGLVVKDLSKNSTVFSNTTTGLQNNTILSIFFDRIGNLWLGLDKGIDYVLINSPVYDLFGNSNLYGSGYSSVVAFNKLFLGTNQGLYVTSMSLNDISLKNKIEPVNHIRGQIWKLAKIYNTIFCGSDQGAFVITEQSTHKISGISGAWGYRPITYDDKESVLGSSYNGFFILINQNGKWMLKNHIEGFTDGGGAFEIDNQNRVWFSHWLKGVFRLTLNQNYDSVLNVEQINQKHGLPTTRNNSLHKINEKIIFSTEGGFYEFKIGRASCRERV